MAHGSSKDLVRFKDCSPKKKKILYDLVPFQSVMFDVTSLLTYWGLTWEPLGNKKMGQRTLASEIPSHSPGLTGI